MTALAKVLRLSKIAPAHLRAAGVFCAGLLLAEVNVLASRHYSRFDATADDRYTLSEPTTNLVSSLSEPVEVFVLLGQGDPLLFEVRQMLAAYRALSPFLKIKYIDPDRDTAEFLAIERKYSVGTDSNPDGRAVADAALFLKKGESTWFIRGGQLSELDQDGHAHLRIEARITEGIAQVGVQKKSRVCFVTGHGEHSVDDAAPEGLLDLGTRLRRSNVEVERVPLDVPDPNKALAGCSAVAVVGPERPWPAGHTAALISAYKTGASLILFLDPIVDKSGKITDSGLASLLVELGVAEQQGFVLETDPSYRLPMGIGESFFAQPKTHSVTRGLSTDESRLDARVVMAAAQPLKQLPTPSTAVILQTSAQAVTLSDLNDPDKQSQTDEPLPLAIAGERSNNNRHQRWLVVGSSSVATNPSFRDPALYGSQIFSEHAFSWLLKSKSLISVPERPKPLAGLHLTEDSLQELLRYVLIYMPLAASCAGAFVLVRRRKRQDASRPDRRADAA